MRSIAVMLGVMCAVTAAAEPVALEHQGRLTDSAGEPINGEHTVEVSLYDASEVRQWSQALPGTSFDNGYFSITLSGTSTDPANVTLDDVFAGPTEPLTIGFSIDGAAELRPLHPLTDVPSAARARRTEGAVLVDITTQTSCGDDGRLGFDSGVGSLFVCVDDAWQAVGTGGSGNGLGSSSDEPGRSCKAIRDAGDADGSGLYWIDPVGAVGDSPVQVYCDMLFGGGGWTLVSYAYRPSGGGSTVYSLPNAFQGVWTPGVRDNIASIDASELVRESTSAMLTTANGAFVDGAIAEYTKQYSWLIPAPASTVFSLPDQSNCDAVSITEHTANSTFSAFVQRNKLQVACSGNKGGTSYERQFLGFCNNGCWGRCGVDNTQCDGMVVHYGSGYDPAVSGGTGEAERAGSFAFWLK